MKHIHNFLKKSLSPAKAGMCAMVTILMMVGNIYGQTYQTIFWDDHPGGSNVPYCPCDSIKCVAPAGQTGIYWAPALTQHGDTLVLESGFDGQIDCFYDAGQKSLNLRPISPPTSPGFPLSDTVCGIGTMTLDALNHLQYGFTSYLWSTAQTTQTITVGQGIRWVTISNACGSVSDTITIVEFNPHPPDLGPDQTVCQNTPVLLDPGTGFNAYFWTPGSYTSATLPVTTSGTYIVRTTDAVTGCVDKDTVIITVLAPSTKPICYVGFDTLNWKNDIYLPTNLSAAIDSFHIYKEVSLGVWNAIGSVAAGTEYFTDMNCNPQNQSYSYKIAVVDTCGNEGALSSPHTTITLLSAYDSGTDTYGFTWSAYVGLSVSDYNLYGIDGTGSVVLIGTVPGNQFFYNYVNPLLTYVKYFIGFDGPDCSAKKSVSLVKSNIVQSTLTGLQQQENDMRLSIFPNPVQKTISITTSINIQKIQIMDVIGNVVLTADQKTIDCSCLSSGIYFIKMISDQWTVTKRVVKQ